MDLFVHRSRKAARTVLHDAHLKYRRFSLPEGCVSPQRLGPVGAGGVAGG